MRASAQVYFNHFISTSGDKLEACVKVVECPSDTALAMARDSYLQATVEDFLSQADLILVSVPRDDRADYSDTRLYTILQKYADTK